MYFTIQQLYFEQSINANIYSHPIQHNINENHFLIITQSKKNNNLIYILKAQTGCTQGLKFREDGGIPNKKCEMCSLKNIRAGDSCPLDSACLLNFKMS